MSVEGNEQEARITSGRAEFVVRVPVGAEITRLVSCGVERHHVTGWSRSQRDCDRLYLRRSTTTVGHRN